jgi:glycogen synthase
MADTTQVVSVCDPNGGSSDNPLRVLHVLDISLPLLTGYTIRSRGILNAQRESGMQPTAISSPMHTLRDAQCRDDEIDGISYLRTPVDGFAAYPIQRRVPVIRELSVMRLLERRISAELRRRRYDLVHAHSPVLVGLPALRAARKHGVPFVYEIRAFWEDAAVDQNKTAQSSMRYKATRTLETHVVRNADAVVGIADSILSDLADRSIDRNKLFYLPNGVNVDQFKPVPRDTALAKELGTSDVPVLGFIGSMYFFEGTNWLVEAAAALKASGVDFKLIIIGHGEDAEPVKKRIQELNAGSYVKFLGKVPHEDILRYYSVMDILVYPRHSNRLTELVTPLKPLEALALGKAVLGSNVGGIRQILGDGEAGLLFAPTNIDSFCEQAGLLIRDAKKREDVASAGFDYVHKCRTWKQIAKKYEDVYAFAQQAASRA